MLFRAGVRPPQAYPALSVIHAAQAIFAKKGECADAGHLVIIISRLRQGRIAGFQGKNAAFDGIATALGLRL